MEKLILKDFDIIFSIIKRGSYSYSMINNEYGELKFSGQILFVDPQVFDAARILIQLRQKFCAEDYSLCPSLSEALFYEKKTLEN